MDASAPWVAPWENTESELENGRGHVFVLWEQFLQPVRMFLTLPGEGVTIWRVFPGLESGLSSLPGEGVFKWNFSPNILKWMLGLG